MRAGKEKERGWEKAEAGKKTEHDQNGVCELGRDPRDMRKRRKLRTGLEVGMEKWSKE